MIPNAGLAEAARLTGQGLGGTKFDEMALGTANTAVAVDQTALGAEITTGGGERKTGGNVTSTLTTTNFANDTINFNAVWNFTSTHGVNEIFVGNASQMFVRQVFASQLNVIPSSSLELDVKVISSDNNGTGNSRWTNAGLVEGNRLLAADLTPTSGRLQAIALGSSATAATAADVALGNEWVVADNRGLARGQEIEGPTVSLQTTNVANDTVRIMSRWQVVTGAAAVQEFGSFTSTDPVTGVLFVHDVLAAPFNLIPTDYFRVTMDAVNVRAP